MMRYRTLIILTTAMILSTLHASEMSKKDVDINDLLKKNVSTLNDNDFKKVKRYLSHKSLIEKKELREEQDEEMDCCLGCLGLAPFALGLYLDVSNMSPSIYGISLGKIAGGIVGTAAMVKFDNGDQPPQTETSKRLALVLQEEKRRKQKID